MASATKWADPVDQGRVRVRLAFDWDTDAVEAALKLNDVIEVLEPAWLRQRVIDAARRILRRHGAEVADAQPV